MDDDRSWLKNPVLPRPPAVPHFSAAELGLEEEERESSVLRVARRTEANEAAERATRREQRVSGTSAAQAASAERREGPALAPRRSA